MSTTTAKPCDPSLKDAVRIMTRSAYDAQKLRMMVGNRLVANFKARLGLDLTKAEADQAEEEKEAMKMLNQLRAEYDRLADCFRSKKNREVAFSENRLLTNETSFYLADEYFGLLANEEKNFRNLGKVLEQVPIYAEFLKDVRGCGPAMSGVIISELDPHKARTPSSFWKYCGLDVAGDGKGRTRKQEHLVDREYKDKNGNDATRKSITYNPFAKTKLMGVLAGSFLRCASPYAQVYKDYKQRLEHHPAHKEKTVAHRHQMAMRYMAKRFLVDLHAKWRALEGLEVTQEYAVRKLGMDTSHHLLAAPLPGGFPSDMVEMA